MHRIPRVAGSRMNCTAIDLRIKAEHIIRTDRIEAGRDVSHLNFERQYKSAMREYLAALQRINQVAGILFPD